MDLTRIDGIDGFTALKVISEIGTDMTKWPPAKHFASWLGLSPHNRITGGRVISSKTKASATVRRRPCGWRPTRCTAPTALSAPSAPEESPSGGAQGHHRHGPQAGSDHLPHAALRQQYVDAGAEYYESQYRRRALRAAKQRAAQLGYQLVPISDPQTSSAPQRPELVTA